MRQHRGGHSFINTRILSTRPTNCKFFVYKFDLIYNITYTPYDCYRRRPPLKIDGAKVRELREGRYLTQAGLGELANLSLYTVHNAESGKGVSAKTGRALAEALGVPVEELAPSPKAPPRPEFFELPGLDAALKRHGMNRSELAFRVGMTPGEVLDYEIGAKNPSSEVVERLANALGAARYELTFPPEQVEARLTTEKRENELFYEEQAEISASEILKERSNPASRRVRDGYEKSESERQAARDREDKLA